MTRLALLLLIVIIAVSLRRPTPFLPSGQYTRLLSTAGSAAAKSVTGFRDRVRYSLYLITVALVVLVYLRDHQLVVSGRINPKQ